MINTTSDHVVLQDVVLPVDVYDCKHEVKVTKPILF